MPHKMKMNIHFVGKGRKENRTLYWENHNNCTMTLKKLSNTASTRLQRTVTQVCLMCTTFVELVLLPS